MLEMLYIFMGGDMNAIDSTLKTMHFSRSFTSIKIKLFLNLD